MTNRLLKKTALDQAGVLVRPVQLAANPQSPAHPAPPSPHPQPSSSNPPTTQISEAERLENLAHDLITQLAHDKERLLEELQPQVVRLSIAIARRIVEAEIRQDRRIVQRTVRAALKELAYASGLQIRVHPDDEPLIQQIVTTDEEIMSNFSPVTLVPDPSVQRGGCVVEVESDRGTIDATISTQFVQLQKSLLAYIQD